MKEIGGIFPIEGNQINQTDRDKSIVNKDRLYYSLCREALHDIAVFNNKGNKKVLIPAYTCQTVITPFEEAGWEIGFYAIHTNLRINIHELIDACNRFEPSIIVAHPYFGMDLNEEEDSALSFLRSKGVKIVVDLTQCLFSAKGYQYCDYIVASYRKWFPIPDGAFLKTSEDVIQQPEIENSEFNKYISWAMYLRGQYFKNGEKMMKDISIALSKKADHLAENNISSHCMSSVSLNILNKEDKEANQLQRNANYSCLYHAVKDSDEVRKVCQDINDVTCAPLYFAIFVNHRTLLQRILAENSIYAPVLWPVEDKRVLEINDASFIYDHILAIPCDQRYNLQDMNKVAELINSFYYE